MAKIYGIVTDNGMENPGHHTEKTRKFIEKARVRHGDRYDYSLTVYILVTLALEIICRIHGSFWQVPTRHLEGAGCRYCAYAKHNGKGRTTEEFIAEARAVHGEKYDYSQTKYVNVNTKVKIICPVCGLFEQYPNAHTKKRCGCKNCSKTAKKTTKSFIEAARKVHGDKYSYEKTVYTSSENPVTITCKRHGDFSQRPDDHLQGKGCNPCSRNMMSREEFIAKATKVHNGRYTYEHVVYEGTAVKVTITCCDHGDFDQMPLRHLEGSGCQKCRGYNRTTEEFVAALEKVHGVGTYDYSEVIFVTVNEKIYIICPKHGGFWQLASRHLRGCGCRKCFKVGFSKVAITWLAYKMVQYKCYIQHAQNGDEYRIPGTSYWVDGYAESLNMVFEFNGDYFHGNPTFHDPEGMNKVAKKTFGELYEKTVQRKKDVLERGYRFEDVWESDWKRGIRAVIKIQRAWRARHKRRVEYITEYVLVFPEKHPAPDDDIEYDEDDPVKVLCATHVPEMENTECMGECSPENTDYATEYILVFPDRQESEQEYVTEYVLVFPPPKDS